MLVQNKVRFSEAKVYNNVECCFVLNKKNVHKAV
mgnify:CR=1 FL=1